MYPFLIGLTVWTAGTLAQSPHLQTFKFTSDSAHVAFSQQRAAMTVSSRLIRTRVRFPSGKQGSVDGQIVFDPASHLTWWTYWYWPSLANEGPKDFLLNSAICLTEDQIVIVKVADGGNLDILQSSERYGSMNDVEKHVLQVIQAHRDALENRQVAKTKGMGLGQQRFKHLDVALPIDFYHLPGQAGPSPLPKLRETTSSDRNWRLVVEGPNRSFAEIVLNGNFDLISARVMPRH